MGTPGKRFTLHASFRLSRLPYLSIRRSPSALLLGRKSTSYPLFYPNFFLTRIRLRSRPVVFTSTPEVPLDAHAASSHNDENESDLTQNRISLPSGGKLVKDVTLIGLATLASKMLGLLREIIIASTFGVGPVATAFKYSSVLPGFSMSLVGGVNGPLHIIVASILSKLPEDHQRKLFHQTKTIMFLVGGIAAALVFLFAELIIHFYAPGLWFVSEGLSTREMAIRQLRIMIPCIVLAAPVGLGFGYMSAEGKHVIPAISPALSSLLLIASCVLGSSIDRSRVFLSGDKRTYMLLLYTFLILLMICSPVIFTILLYAYPVETLPSYGASLGIFLQWIIQVIVLKDRWFHISLDSWVDIMKNSHVHEFVSLLLPAIITLGLRQIASFTDLCFASLIPGGVAGLSYAHLLVMAPVGLLSSIIVLPLLPTLSKLTKAGSWQTLIKTLKRAVLLSMIVILPIFSISCILSEPIIHVLFERHAFDSSARALVSSLFLLYSLGSPFFILRELLVVVFYAFGDGKGPFLVNTGAIILNALLDWLFVSRYYLGAEGLALSTSFTTALSVIVLFFLLQRKLSGVLDPAALVCPAMLLSFCCMMSSFATFTSYEICKMLPSSLSKRTFWIKGLFSIAFAGALGVCSFVFPLLLLHFSGFTLIQDFLQTLTHPKS